MGYVCLRLTCTKETGSNLLLYCKEHSDEIERSISTGAYDRLTGDNEGDKGAT